MKKNYQFTLRFDLKAIDDVEARIISKEILERLFLNWKDSEMIDDMKLQRVFDNKPPERVKL